jgi:serine/threonine protein phosphatase PrpC
LQDGAAVVAVWVVGEMVLVANTGDAKAVLARKAPDDTVRQRPAGRLQANTSALHILY